MLYIIFALNLILFQVKFEDIFKKVDLIQLSSDVVVGSISDLVVTKEGNFIISDPIGNSVLIFDRHGKFLKRIGNVGSGPGEYRSPNRLAIDKHGNIYVEDRGNRRINIYSPAGEFKNSFKLQRAPVVSLNVDEEGRVYTYCPAGIGKDEFVIYVYSRDGELINRFGLLPEFMWDFPFVISGGGMVIDEKGFVYQVHPVEYVINKYSRDGKLIKRFKGNSSFYKAPYLPDLKTIQTEYQRWLDSWTPVSGLYLLEGKHIIALLNLGMDKNGSKKLCMDIFNLDGEIIIKDIEILMPKNYSVIGACKDGFYFLEQIPPDEKGNLPNPRVVKYVKNK